MKQPINAGEQVNVYVTQYEDIFEGKGKETLFLLKGAVRKTTETYLILEDATGRLHFVSLSKHTIEHV